MFYYPNVLQRHTGCFSTIWLAATRGTKIMKREYMKVNVIITCKKIIEYILLQVPAPYVGSPIPRLSLYLSAQLSYGVVRVYHRQCDLLLDEIKNTLDRLHKSERQIKIDLLLSEQQSLIPDALMQMEMLEDAPNPFFGLMGIPPELPDPFMIPQIRHLLETPSPEKTRLDKTPPRRRRERRTEESDHLSSPESITLRDTEPVILPEVEVVPDLPEITAHDLEFFMSTPPPFPEEEILPEGDRVKPGDGREKSRAKPKEAERVPPKEPDVVREPSGRSEKRTEISERQQEAEKQRELRKAAEDRELIRAFKREIERLIVSERQRLQQQAAEQEKETQQKTKRERQYEEDTEKEKERLREALRDIKSLRESGAEADALREKSREIERLKNLQKLREERWEAEKRADQLREHEREKAWIQEAEQERERLREAEREIERLKKDLEERGRKRVDQSEESTDVPRKTEREPLTPRLSPITRLPSDVLPQPESAIVGDDFTEEPMVPLPEMTPERPSPPFTSPMLPPSQLSSPQLMLPDITPADLHGTPVRHVVKKSNLIIDKETQIDSKHMREQIKTPQVHTQSMIPVAASHLKFRTLQSLFNSPTYPYWMAPELTSLWSRCAVLEQIPFTEEQQEESMSELEDVRGATESGLSAMKSSELSLEASEEERSRLSYIAPEEKKSVASQDERHLPMVSEMPEVIVELPEVEEILIEDLERNVYSEIDSHGQSEFPSVTQRFLSRMLVSSFFYRCLVLCSQQVIRMEQTTPYGQILITPGQRYTHE